MADKYTISLLCGNFNQNLKFLQRISRRQAEKDEVHMRDMIVVMLYTLSLMIDVMARKIAGKENEDKEYFVSCFGHSCWYC